MLRFKNKKGKVIMEMDDKGNITENTEEKTCKDKEDKEKEEGDE